MVYQKVFVIKMSAVERHVFRVLKGGKLFKRGHLENIGDGKIVIRWILIKMVCESTQWLEVAQVCVQTLGLVLEVLNLRALLHRSC
jgi:hypothetical protein